MTIAYPAFNLYCELEESTVLNLVIENQQIFSDVISDIYDQCSGESGRLILSENNEPLELRKRAELITQIIPFEINQRDLVNKLYAEIKNVSVNERFYQHTQKLMADIALYIYMITESADNEIGIDVPQDISGILKYKDMLLRKFKVICIENNEHTHLEYSKNLIIDKDMCVI